MALELKPGYNQEDSLMLSKTLGCFLRVDASFSLAVLINRGQSAVDRGFMRAVSYRCYAAEEHPACQSRVVLPF